MANITYEDVNPTLIENTTMQKLLRDGVHQAYYITPIVGYVLHDNTYDYTDIDGNYVLGYRTATASCGANYDFTANPRAFCTYKEGNEPADINDVEATEADYQNSLRDMGVKL